MTPAEHRACLALLRAYPVHDGRIQHLAGEHVADLRGLGWIGPREATDRRHWPVMYTPLTEAGVVAMASAAASTSLG